MPFLYRLKLYNALEFNSLLVAIISFGRPPCSKLLIHTLGGPAMTWMCGEKDAILVAKNLRYWTLTVRFLRSCLEMYFQYHVLVLVCS